MGKAETWGLPTDAIERVSGIIGPRTIIEIGSGPNTRIWVSKGFTVYSIEHDPMYICPIVKRTLRSKISNGWYDHKEVEQFVEGIQSREPVHGLIIDGPPGRVGRVGIMQHIHWVSRIPLILVDDIHRLEERRVFHWLSQCLPHEPSVYSVGPRNYGILSTF